MAAAVTCYMQRTPFGRGIDYDFYHQCFGQWFSLVTGLLNSHQVRLPNEPFFWFIQMGDFSSDDVSYNIFGPLKGAVAMCVGICWRGLRWDEDTGSGSQVNRLFSKVLV